MERRFTITDQPGTEEESSRGSLLGGPQPAVVLDAHQIARFGILETPRSPSDACLRITLDSSTQ
jgi:hypothetical protein